MILTIPNLETATCITSHVYNSTALYFFELDRHLLLGTTRCLLRLSYIVLILIYIAVLVLLVGRSVCFKGICNCQVKTVAFQTVVHVLSSDSEWFRSVISILAWVVFA